MMRPIINIDKLSEKELISLNRQIIDRLKILQQVKIQQSMNEFRLGDRVHFASHSGEMVEGVLVRHNKKTVSIITDDGRQWNISPGFLRKIKDTPNAFDQDTDKISLTLIKK